MHLSDDQVRLLRDLVANLEGKERRVRTAAGARRFKQPIGSIIVDKPDVPSAPRVRAPSSRSSSSEPASSTFPYEFSNGYASAKATPSGYLYNIVVSADARGQGYGTDLMNQIIEAADKFGIELQLNAREDLHDFYAKFGFKLSDQQSGFDEPLLVRPAKVKTSVSSREVSAIDVDDAWQQILTDEAQSLEDRKAAHPERYNPSGKPGYGLKDGEIETRVVRQDGPPRIRDYQNHTSAGLTMSEAIEVDGMLGMGATGYGRPLVPVGEARPPQHVYRVMSVDEFESARERGYIKSDERMNLGEGEGTVTSLFSTGAFYAPVDGSDYRVVRIRYQDSDGWERDPVDSYIKTQKRVPFDRVDLFSSPIANHIKPQSDPLDDIPVVGAIQLGTPAEKVDKLEANNLIEGLEPTDFNGAKAWEDLRFVDDPSDGRLEMAASMVIDRLDKEDQGRVLTDEEEVAQYIGQILMDTGYGKRMISVTSNEAYFPNDNVRAAVSRGMTEQLPEDHPLHGKPVPVLMFRPSGISEVVLLHEIAHMLEGSWTDTSQGHNGHNWNWWETWGQLLKLKGLTVSVNLAQLLGASMEGKGVFK